MKDENMTFTKESLIWFLVGTVFGAFGVIWAYFILS